ncbi:SusC/RagA family TonB-linked outer membrane protein [Algoriphagus zhangzhouensis]|uniref:TonB-linked outer membrane protein, SusC/RagA family n=1 Tax=Algoriphagus zhangzhouensis TaxID=1073327 RepID=A0A1M7ZAD3_9BACT|nr:TonB-dependent receptor [Algoriphagus zhangzhouensis]TDY47168.1 TonB-linked SusC/RagA family outer membrane protein [Algoriphagus zhangzhouensis]SHO61873.1 TonB-linked outer membrane protein, SusC/RagA family [Algoriphagus zhangzhouensis]
MKHVLRRISVRHTFIRGMGLWALVMLAVVFQSLAQTQVKGNVTDNSGLGMPGVSVLEKGTQNGTITGLDGEFSISTSSENSVLIFSFIGYQTIEMPVDGQSTINITLKEEDTLLDQVVVVGYGTQRKVNVTGAVDQVSGEDIIDRPIANLVQGLQGMSPGLNITYQGGRPGSVPNINIRGFTSINGGGPLIVIDGVAGNNSDLLRLNPSDIESYSVLRDAASAAIYGARAAFGVILITTKKGQEGRQKISYNNYFSWGRPTVLVEPVTDPYIYSRVLETSTNNTPWDYVNYSDQHYQWAKERSEDPSVEDTRLDPNNPNLWAYMGNNNWYDYFFSPSSFSQNHSLSISGSSGGKVPVSYYVSGDYTNENGLNKLADDYWDRYSLRSRVTANPLPWLNVDNNLNIYQTKRADPTNSITDIYYLQPTDVAVNPDGTWANTSAGRLAGRLTDGGKNEENMFGFHNILRTTGTFLNGDLTVNANASFKREQWKYHRDQRRYNIGYGPGDVRAAGGDGSVIERNGDLSDIILDLYGRYEKTLGDHTFGILAGYNQQSYTYSTIQAEKRILISSSLPYIGLTTGDAFITPTYSTYGTRSVFGRANYSFKNKYILELNGRYDGSSRFPSSNRWGFFPSVSGSWLMMDEDFFSGLTNTVSTFKLRASYGGLGNQNVSDFGYIQALPTGLSSYLINGDRQTIITSSPSLAVDPNFYTWEQVVTSNFGLDFGMLADRITGSFDYFVRDTKGMLTDPVELPGVLGTSPPKQNAADLRTKGFELTLGYRDTYGSTANPVNFGMRLVLSDSRSEITKFQNEQNLFSNYRVGQQIGELWGLVNDGMFQSEDEIEQLDQSAIVPWGALDIVPGWPKYVDLDGDGKIERGQTTDDPKDLQVIGNTSARYRYGANVDVAWSGFDLSVFVQGVGKRDYYPHHYLFWGPYQQPYANVYPWNLDFYRGQADSEALMAQHSQSYIDAGLAEANLDSEYPILQSWLADNNYGSGLDIPQTKYLLSAAYLRIKNVTLGYTFPEVITDKIKVDRVRVFVSGENLFEFSSIKKFIDPEAINDGYGWAYPFQRKLSFGVNIDL